MGWFLTGGGPAAVDGLHCAVSVLRVRDGKSAGAGVLLTPGSLLTCAHVVNDALGRGMFETGAPGDAALQVLHIGPRAKQRYTARVTHWVPPRRLDGSPQVREKEDREWLGDLAVLRFEVARDAHLPQPQWRPMRAGQNLRAWHSSGLYSSFADVRVKSCDGSIGYVDGDPTGMSIGPAFSGGALWSVLDQAVVGLVAAHIMPPEDPVTRRPLPHSSQHIARRSWGIPWQRVRSELAAVGAAALVGAPEPDSDDPAFPLLADLIGDLVPSSALRGDLGRLVAARCGIRHADDGSAPTPEEFALLLVTEERALAALTEVLRLKDPAAAGQLLAAGRLSTVPRLLSLREHRRLHELLDLLPAPVQARLPEAVRAALPLAADYPMEPSVAHRTEELVERLERLPGDSRAEASSPRVPGLLRVVEYVAVLCPEDRRAGLRLWCDGVAQRLGIPRSALGERRSDADDWGRTLAERTAPPRVLVHVTRGGSAERYRLRIWCDEGAGPRQVSADGDRTYSGEEAARALLRVLESLYRSAPGDHRPLVEALVDRAGLNLPIDEWESFGPDDLVPGVLGAEYPLVVNCPELLRRNERFLPEWRRRWRQLDTGSALRITDTAAGLRQVYGTLMDRLDAVRVAVDVPPHLRDEIVEVCLAVGVPVVVWDREAGPESHAVEHMTAVNTRELPEGVRSYRAKTVHRPRDYPGRPVLAWADADRTVPQLHLSEPQESR
ncbi:trypsin-like peptidase domain-containing protein [Streptomyces sp. NPDC015127]|uniref:VMAP-C domain-containing protein n=1 Tax=Streptomyces sp. NPDC015127 TaxID=3364939 RepID=UPI0036F99A0F